MITTPIQKKNIKSKKAGSPTIQTKLTIGGPNDKYEKEADAMADRIMRMPQSFSNQPLSTGANDVQRKCAACDQEEDKIQLKPLMMKSEGGAAVATQALGAQLNYTKGSGSPLPSVTNSFMSNAFGTDFSKVRVHTGGRAIQMNQGLNARAFTHGADIYFNKGQYSPGSSEGKRLLGHELTHVVQQGHAKERSGKDSTQLSSIGNSNPQTIQRVANWAAPALHETNNLANTALNGAEAGVTSPMFNGTILATVAGARAALNAPTLIFNSSASGGVDAAVGTVPSNTGGVDETVLSAGPWRLRVSKASIGAEFPTLTQCTGAGLANFRARGKPSDRAMAAANRRHEDRHASDGRTAFNGSVVPWDTRLTAAKTAGTKFNGATEAAARTALFTAMGGTRDQVSDAFTSAWIAARDAYHATPRGGPVSLPTDPVAAPDCSWAFARYTNPS